jgi:hypothetical protein
MHQESQVRGPSLRRTVVSLFSPSLKMPALTVHHSVKRVAAVKMIQDQRDADSSRRVLPFHWLHRVGS